MKEFAEMLKDGMGDKGYSEFKLASDACLSVKTIKRYLNPNYKYYELETLLAIAKVLYSSSKEILDFLTSADVYAQFMPKYKTAMHLILYYPSVNLDDWNDLLVEWGEVYRIPRRYKSKIK